MTAASATYEKKIFQHCKRILDDEKNSIIQLRGNFQSYVVNVHLMNFFGDGGERAISIYLVPTIFSSLCGYNLIQSLQSPVRQELLSLMKWRLGPTAHLQSL